MSVSSFGAIGDTDVEVAPVGYSARYERERSESRRRLAALLGADPSRAPDPRSKPGAPPSAAASEPAALRASASLVLRESLLLSASPHLPRLYTPELPNLQPSFRPKSSRNWADSLAHLGRLTAIAKPPIIPESRSLPALPSIQEFMQATAASKMANVPLKTPSSLPLEPPSSVPPGTTNILQVEAPPPSSSVLADGRSAAASLKLTKVLEHSGADLPMTTANMHAEELGRTKTSLAPIKAPKVAVPVPMQMPMPMPAVSEGMPSNLAAQPKDHHEAETQLLIKKAATRLVKVLQANNGGVGGEELFKVLDPDNSQKITRSEFEEKMYHLGVLSRPRTINLLFDFIDADSSGAIDMMEFSKLLMSVKMDQDTTQKGHKPEQVSGFRSEALKRQKESGDLNVSVFAHRERVQRDLQAAIQAVRRRGKTAHAVASGSYGLLSGQGLFTAMKFFDTDGSGTIEKDELGKALVMIGMPLSDELLHDVIDVYDSDKSGTLEAEEIVNAFFPKSSIWKPMQR